MPTLLLLLFIFFIKIFWLSFNSGPWLADLFFFDKFGHCERTQPFDLADEKYILKHIGGGFVHETLICDITLKSPTGYGVCLTFEDLEIDDCSVRIKIYTSSTSTGPEWRSLDCNDDSPGQMCTTDRFVTVRVVKDKLNYNRGYSFEIHVEKSHNITEKGVLFASIGVFVAVILGVVILTSILFLLFLYCCCCRRRSGFQVKTLEINQIPLQENGSLVQPSAPPVDIEDRLWAANSTSHMYTHSQYGPYPLQHMPPPYTSPPPYQQDCTVEVTRYTQGPLSNYPVK
ncbi:unnamed protein product [Candidula unifasciata]|uniref:Uncharacterized protein n=1 Tax=Candidula unifasciata TaxID=100452 RepID=A0A8S3ZLC6_9EUPU|nr:unnamed protein product [Candidula unifasciata]